MPAVDLVHVRRGRGRVHLAAGVEAGRPVHTLCGKALEGVDVTRDEPDCQLCVRRREDPAVISTAFFNEEKGSELLELSLAAARRRREGRPDLRVVPSPPRPRPAPSGSSRPTAPPPPPARRGELLLAGLREFTEDVYVTPAGVVVRMDGQRISEIACQVDAQLQRTPGGLRVRFGDLVVESGPGGVTARLAASQ